MSLAERRCVPCEGNDPPLTREQAATLLEQIPEWKLAENAKSIHREFPFKDFATALAFVDRVGEVAQDQWHHPDIRLSWGRVEITLTTHAIHGLSENDFIVAAHIDLLG
jgi:4a-hydroxytetrahydrobiopterin dehydratase